MYPRLRISRVDAARLLAALAVPFDIVQTCLYILLWYSQCLHSRISAADADAGPFAR